MSETGVKKPSNNNFSKRQNQFVAKVLSFQNSFVPDKKDTVKGTYMFGLNDRLPNELMAFVLDSGTAKLAQEKRAEYIAAYGFNDKETAKFKVNTKQTANELLDEISGYESYFKGFALKVIRDGNKKVAKCEVLPFQDVRKKQDGNFIYNPTLSAVKYDRKKDVVIPAFKEGELTKDEYQATIPHGEIFYVYKKTADNPHYPVPGYYAGIEDIRSSAELQKFDLETVLNSFITSAILTVIGDIDDETTDDSGKTEWDYYLEALESFTGQQKDSNGLTGRMKMLVMKARSKDQVPDLKPFDAKVIIDASNSKREIIDRSVSRLFGVNPVLIGFADAQVLGNQQAMANASSELAKSVVADQLMVTEAMKTLFKDVKDWSITQYRPIQYVPDKLLDKLTDNELRGLAGYPELPKENNTDTKLLTERLGVVGTQSLIFTLTDPNLKPGQKRETLKLLFGLSDDDAKKLVPEEIASAEPANPAAP